jgi:hypothetical protein
VTRFAPGRRPSPALVISLIALFVSLSGSSYAALVISGKNVRNNSLTGKDIKKGSLGGSDVKNRSLGGADVKGDSLGGRQVKESSLGKVAAAVRSDVAGTALNAGTLGGSPPDAFARRLFAVVDGVSTVPVVTRSSGGVTVTRLGKDGSGEYTVRFPQDVSKCAYSVTAGDARDGDQVVRFFVDASKDEGSFNGVDVAVNDYTADSDEDNDGSFNLIVIC